MSQFEGSTAQLNGDDARHNKGDDVIHLPRVCISDIPPRCISNHWCPLLQDESRFQQSTAPSRQDDKTHLPKLYYYTSHCASNIKQQHLQVVMMWDIHLNNYLCRLWMQYNVTWKGALKTFFDVFWAQIANHIYTIFFTYECSPLLSCTCMPPPFFRDV